MPTRTREANHAGLLESEKFPEPASAVEAAVAALAVKPSENKLEFVRDRVRRAQELELEIADAEDALGRLRGQLFEILMSELPALFDELGLTKLGVQPRGNHPGGEAKLTTFYKASLPKDERKEQALRKFKWLGELAKRTYTVLVDRGDAKLKKKLEVALRKSKIPFQVQVSVHASTLTAEIRRRYEDGRPLPPADLDLLGAYVGPMVKIEQVKEKK
jgi:hypothetical protein